MSTSPDENETMRISIVVPMCNEEDSLALLRGRLLHLHEDISSRYKVEYCLVDDGSTDGTRALMSSVAPAGAETLCLFHEQNQGIGAAIRTGLRGATGTIACTIDADCSYPPENLRELIEMVASGHCDIAVASPYHPHGGVEGVKPWRLLLSRQCSLLYRLCSPLKLYTYTSIFRAYNSKSIRALKFESNGFVSAVETLLDANSKGFRIAEHPMVLHARQHGVSKIKIVTTIAAHLVVIWKSGCSSLSGMLGQRKPPRAQVRAKDGAPVRISAAFATVKEESLTR